MNDLAILGRRYIDDTDIQIQIDVWYKIVKTLKSKHNDYVSFNSKEATDIALKLLSLMNIEHSVSESIERDHGYGCTLGHVVYRIKTKLK